MNTVVEPPQKTEDIAQAHDNASSEQELEATAQTSDLHAVAPPKPPIEVPKELEPLAERLKEMLEAGLHFGHRVSLWNPKMKPYIHTKRNGIHILNLLETIEKLEAAKKAISSTILQGGKVLFVCTKRQGQKKNKEICTYAGMPYIDHRWLGGFFTNFHKMHERIKYLRQCRQELEAGEYNNIPKKEKARKMKEIQRLENLFGGVTTLNKLPQMLVVIDPKREYNAIREAQLARIPIIATLDTNCDPDQIDLGIPANDDAIRSISFILEELGQTAKVARDQFLATHPNAERTQDRRFESKNNTTEAKKTTKSSQKQLEKAAEDLDKKRIEEEKQASIEKEIRSKDRFRVNDSQKDNKTSPKKTPTKDFASKLPDLPTSIIKLLNDNFSDWLALQKANHDDLVAISGIGEAKASQIIEALKKQTK